MNKLTTRLISKINAAELSTEPCSNIFIEEIFDPEVYSELMVKMPETGLFKAIDHPDAKDANGQPTRGILDLAPHTIDRMPAADQSFWIDINEALTAPEVTAALFRKLKVEGDEATPAPIFYRDYPDYYISIHTDAPYKLATLQFYLAFDLSQVALGTSFHRKVGDRFDLIKTNRFLPNSAYAFARTDSSWHSVDRLPQSPYTRNTLALTYYQKGYEYSSLPGYVAPEKRLAQ